MSNGKETIDVMLPCGRWFRLAEWCADESDYDASGWLDEFADRIGTGKAPLPMGGYVNLAVYAAIK